jgi:hypothetical protein
MNSSNIPVIQQIQDSNMADPVVVHTDPTNTGAGAGGSNESLTTSDSTTTLSSCSTSESNSIFTKGTEPYNDWICPISFKLMVDPVVAQDGHSYERTEIEKWLQSHSTSPMDRTAITNKDLYPNIALRTSIQLWKKYNPTYEKKDEELDRQLELVSLRAKPAPVREPARRRPSSYITHIATVAFPGWHVVYNNNRVYSG